MRLGECIPVEVVKVKTLRALRLPRLRHPRIATAWHVRMRSVGYLGASSLPQTAFQGCYIRNPCTSPGTRLATSLGLARTESLSGKSLDGKSSTRSRSGKDVSTARALVHPVCRCGFLLKMRTWINPAQKKQQHVSVYVRGAWRGVIRRVRPVVCAIVSERARELLTKEMHVRVCDACI